MNALRDFLNWFDGFQENIETAPSEKQWGRVRERIEALRAADAASPSPPVPPIPQAALVPTSNPTPRTSEIWLAAAKKALEDMGCDPDTAREMLPEFTVDLDIEPSDAAKEVFHKYF